MFKKINQNKGAVLQIVLVLFLLFMFVLSLMTAQLKDRMDSYNNILEINKQKNIEILLIQKYVKEVGEGYFFSESINRNDCFISYQIDDMYDCYNVLTEIKTKRTHYFFKVSIDKKTCHLKAFEYQ